MFLYVEGANSLVKTEVGVVEGVEAVAVAGGGEAEEEVALKGQMLQQKILTLSWMLTMKRFDDFPCSYLHVFIYNVVSKMYNNPSCVLTLQ